MALQIRRPGDRDRPANERPLDLLLACHERIRSFSALARTLAEAVAPSPSEIAEAAGALGRYFDEALRLHVADEERTIRAALLGNAPTPEVAQALEAMADEHSQHELLLSELIPCWRVLAEEPRRMSELALRLDPARRLPALFEPHLELEEKRIFPALAALDEPTTRTILKEMRARREGRGGPASTPRGRSGRG
jgi:hypothetical protein